MLKAGTKHVVQTFRMEGQALAANPEQTFKSPESAVAAAERLAERATGVVAFSMEMDSSVDFFGEPKILFRAGRLPPELQDV